MKSDKMLEMSVSHIYVISRDLIAHVSRYRQLYLILCKDINFHESWCSLFMMCRFALFVSVWKGMFLWKYNWSTGYHQLQVYNDMWRESFVDLWWRWCHWCVSETRKLDEIDHHKKTAVLKKENKNSLTNLSGCNEILLCFFT